MIGTLGGLVFEASAARTLTPNAMTRTVSSRAVAHETIGGKPRTEFLGPGLQTVQIDILLRADLGTKPRATLEQLERMVETGEVNKLVIGGRPVGQNKFRVTGTSETWNHVFRGGELFSASVTLDLEEYL